MRLWFYLLLLTGAIASMGCLWFTGLPLGIPGEWTWPRVAAEPDLIWNLVGIVVAAALYVAFVELGSRQLEGEPSKVKVIGWLTGLVVVGFIWLWVVQESAPIVSRIGKSAFVLYYSSSSGYFTKARYENPDPHEFLRGYEALMREGDVLHVGTHPPGLFLVFHGLIGLAERCRWLESLDATQPSSFQEACDVIAGNSVRSTPPRPLLAVDRRILWMATLLVMATASLSVLPLFALLRRQVDPAAAWCGAALWPAVPAVAMFVPKSDVAYAFLGLLMVLTWLMATERRSTALAALTGLIVWCGLMTSLAFLPVGLFMAIVAWKAPLAKVPASDSVAANRTGWISGAPPFSCALAAMAGFAVPTLLLGWWGQINMLSVWRLNYLNHAAFYSKFARTYWKWLLENPVELAFAVGWPVFALAALYVVTSFRNRRSGFTTPVLGSVVVLGILWLTGKNSSEAARLWIVFLPWLVWLAGIQLAKLDQGTAQRWLRPSIVALAMQLIVCALTVIRVSGFDL